MEETDGSTPLDTLRSFAFLAAPLAIAIGDFFFRWGGDLGYFSRLAPSNFYGSFALSAGVWLALSQLAGSFRRRWAAAVVCALPIAFIINAAWGYRDVRDQDPTPGVAFYILQEPKNALELLAGGIDVFVIVRLLLLAAIFTVSLGAKKTDWSRITVLTTILVPIAYILASFGWYVPNPSTEFSYQTDVYLGVIVGKSIQRAADVGTSDALSATERHPIDPKLSADAPERPPNVVFIIGESLNRNMISHHGYDLETTPRIDTFLERHHTGVVDFERAFSNSTFSPISVGTLLNGMYAGQPSETYHSAPSLWQYASARGVYSFLVATQQWSWSNLDFFLLDGVGPDVAISADNMALPLANDTGVDDRLAAARFVEELEVATESGKPWFGTFQTNASHYPLLVNEDVPWEIESKEGRFASATYVTDEAVGIILDALRDGGHLDDTVIIFTADHSEVFESKADKATPKNTSPDFQFGGRIESCHPLLTRVPFFVYVPESLRGEGSFHAAMKSRREALVSHVDVTPTILDLWGVEPVEPVDGISLGSPTATRDYVLCFTCPSWARWLLNGFGVIGTEEYFSVREDFEHPLVYDTDDPEIYRSRITGAPADADDLARLDSLSRKNTIIERYLGFDRLAPILRSDDESPPEKE